MSKRDFFLVVVLVATVVSGIETSCQHSIFCPCGTEGNPVNYIQCVGDTFDERSACERWVNCKTCAINTTYCLTCPPGRYGPTCMEVTCSDPGIPRNGGVIVYYNSRLNHFNINNPEEYPVRTRLTYDCKSGYRLVGQKNLVCRSTGSWEGRKPACIEDCGVSTSTAGSRITGTNTKAGEFPWIVFLYMNETSDTCGGVLLDRRTVLTAAHCLEMGDYTTLYFGKYNRSDEYDGIEVKTRTISEITIHPEFNPETFDNDIAIVKFSPDVSYSWRIQPICLPSPDSTRMDVVPGNMGFVAGWGLNENHMLASRLKLVSVPVQTSETCISAYARRGVKVTMTQGMFCGGYADKGNNICAGDGGSPLVFYNKQTERFVLEGIVSFGSNGRCYRPERYTFFTRVSHYLGWILENLRDGNI